MRIRKMRIRKRLFSLLLCGAMLFSLFPQPAFAVGVQERGFSIGAGGLCEHHPEHTAECGYTEGSEGTPCSHEHNEGCYALVTECVHEHTEDCYPEESVSDNTATPSDAEDREPTNCTHECSEENGCIKKELDCQHEHDSKCGYAPAEPGQPCTFVCEICNSQEGDEPADKPQPDEGECVCAELCTADAVNEDCPVCGAEGADLAACKGEPVQEETKCICAVPCTEDAINKDCPVCSSENADLTKCEGKEVGEQAKAVQAQIDALPSLEDIQAMSPEEQQKAHEKVQAAYDAYNALTDEQKAQITGAEIFESLFAVFDSMMNALSDHQHPVCGSDGNCTDPNHETGHEDVTWTAWNETNSMPISTGNYYLTGDITLSATWEVPSGTTQLCLNGHSIKYENEETNGSVIKVPQNVSLTITDCADAKNPGKITGGTGTVYSNSIGYCGGGLFVQGTVSMYGGSIVENEVTRFTSYHTGRGAGVFVDKGAFSLYGGTITQNHSEKYGGGVYCKSGAFTMTGGEITKNDFSNNVLIGSPDIHNGFGGAVSLDEEATAIMSGGCISENSSGYGQIHLGDGTFTMSGNAIIKDGKEATHGGSAVLCISSFPDSDVSQFNMFGGTIHSGDTGIHLQGKTTTMTMTDGTISAKDPGIEVYAGSTLDISGGKIEIPDGKNSISMKKDPYDKNAVSSVFLSGAPEISSISMGDDRNRIQIKGQLTYTSPITVNKPSRGTITSGWTDKMETQANDYAQYFQPSNSNDEITLFNREVYVKPQNVPHFHGSISFTSDLKNVNTDSGSRSITQTGNYFLSDDLELGDLYNTLYIGDGTSAVTVNLCLNGYQLSSDDSVWSGPVIIIRENATLNLYDCEDYNTNARKHTYISPVNSSSKTVDGGLITGGTGRTADREGTKYSYGGGILVYGTLNMHGGTIAGNSAAANGVAGGFGGGVYVVPSGTFTMDGGAIQDNKAKTSGGGVTVAAAADAVPASTPLDTSLSIGGGTTNEWTGGSKIEDSAEMQTLFLSARNGNVAAAFTLSGGSITSNAADSVAGGVNARGTVTVKKDSQITIMENTATTSNSSSNLYFPEPHTDLNVSSVPESGSQIGVRMENPGQFATMSNPNSARSFFTSDDAGYVVSTTNKGLTLTQCYETPSITIDYENETLTDFEAEGSYTINGKTVSVAEDNAVSIHEDWFGTSVSIVRTGSLQPSAPQSLLIPARPDAPAAPIVADRTSSSIDVTAVSGQEYKLGNGEWQTASGDTITFVSLAAGQSYTIYTRIKTGQSSFASAEASVTISTKEGPAAAPVVGDPTVTASTVTLPQNAAWEYSTDGNSWSDTYHFTGLEAATKHTYYVRVKETVNAEASEAATIAVYTAKAAPNTGVGYTVNYELETLSVTAGYEVNTVEDFSGTAISNGDSIRPGTVYYVRAASSTGEAGLTIPCSEAVGFTLNNRPDAPGNLQGENETFAGDNDGKITGTSSKMEYKLSTAASWTPCAGESVTGLAPGIYHLRFKAMDNTFASLETTVEIKTGEQRTYTLNVTAPVFEPVTYGYIQPVAKTITISSTGNSDATISNVTVDSQNFVISGSGSTVTAGGSIETWTIQPSAGLDAGTYNATITVTYTGGATATTQVSFTVNPVAQEAPAAPTVKSTSSHSITLNPITANENGAAAEYTRDNGATWQSSPEFTGLSSGTQYTFVARYQSLPNYEASPASDPVTASTNSSSGGGSSGGGSSSNNDSTIIDRPDKDDPTNPTTAETKTVKTDSKGSIVITKSMVADAISTAQADARKNDNTANGVAVVVPVEIDKTLDGVQITLKADALDKLVSSGVKRFTIDTDRMADFGFTLDTLKELNRQTTGDVILKVKTTAVTSQEAKAAVGNRPAYDITLWYLKDGKETPVSLNGKTVSIAIPYTPAKNEQTGNLYAVYVDGNGKVQWFTKSSYDADQKAVIFEAQHFSIYGVGYKSPVPNFTDISGHWAKEHILFTVSRGLFSGISETTFSPNTTLTRGMFVTALGRLSGINPADYQTGRFTDVKADAYYAPYVNWAAKTGIVDGTTSTTFAPDSNITREQMAVIMKNYAGKMGCSIPKTLEAVTFADNAQISSWAKDAVKAMQQAGVLSGKENNRFDPKGSATRAEAATVLHRFVEVIIDPQTANGWVQNDSGEWNYYKDGKPVKGWLSDEQKWYWLDKSTGKMFTGGWKQIDGRWYYFYTDGSMALNTTIDGHTIGSDGARKD